LKEFTKEGSSPFLLFSSLGAPRGGGEREERVGEILPPSFFFCSRSALRRPPQKKKKPTTPPNPPPPPPPFPPFSFPFSSARARRKGQICGPTTRSCSSPSPFFPSLLFAGQGVEAGAAHISFSSFSFSPPSFLAREEGAK